MPLVCSQTRVKVNKEFGECRVAIIIGMGSQIFNKCDLLELV